MTDAELDAGVARMRELHDVPPYSHDDEVALAICDALEAAEAKLAEVYARVRETHARESNRAGEAMGAGLRDAHIEATGAALALISAVPEAFDGDAHG